MCAKPETKLYVNSMVQGSANIDVLRAEIATIVSALVGTIRKYSGENGIPVGDAWYKHRLGVQKPSTISALEQDHNWTYDGDLNGACRIYLSRLNDKGQKIFYFDSRGERGRSLNDIPGEEVQAARELLDLLVEKMLEEVPGLRERLEYLQVAAGKPKEVWLKSELGESIHSMADRMLASVKPSSCVMVEFDGVLLDAGGGTTRDEIISRYRTAKARR